MSVKIIADSGCDLTIESAEKAGIDLVPFHVLFVKTESSGTIPITKTLQRNNSIPSS